MHLDVLNILSAQRLRVVLFHESFTDVGIANTDTFLPARDYVEGCVFFTQTFQLHVDPM